MKKNTIFLIPIVLVLFMGCVEFPTSYSVIESDKPRLLDFMYEPTEAAPGDTVLLKAVFAGREITADDLSWSISTKIIANEYGASTALDTSVLDVQYKDIEYSENTSCIAFAFVIPDRVLVESPYVPEQWISLLPEYAQHSLSAKIPRKKDAVLNILKNGTTEQGKASITSDKELTFYLPLLLQVFSAPVYIHCEVNGSHPIRSEYVVRYNRHYTTYDDLFVPVNHNPQIDSAVLYVVDKEDLALFDPDSTSYSFSRSAMYADSIHTIHVLSSKSYFIGIYNGVTDSTLSIDGSIDTHSALYETIWDHWYIEYDESEKEEVGISERITIEDGIMYDSQIISQFYPPLNEKITQATLWVELTDGFLNEMNRPLGSVLGEYRVMFRYDD